MKKSITQRDSMEEVIRNRLSSFSKWIFKEINFNPHFGSINCLEFWSGKNWSSIAEQLLHLNKIVLEWISQTESDWINIGISILQQLWERFPWAQSIENYLLYVKGHLPENKNSDFLIYSIRDNVDDITQKNWLKK